jgi:hypothetical protein
MCSSGINLLLALALGVTLAGCTAGTTDPVTPPASSSIAGASSLSSVVAALRAERVEVKEVETLEQPFFPVPAHIHTVNGEDLQVYEFATAADAERAAAQVDARGSTIGTTQMSWMAPPHFYRNGRVIAIHLGSSSAARAALERVMGKPFAGHD